MSYTPARQPLMRAEVMFKCSAYPDGKHECSNTGHNFGFSGHDQYGRPYTGTLCDRCAAEMPGHKEES